MPPPGVWRLSRTGAKGSLSCERMASTPRSPEREEERRLNVRTLVIASAASASAAAVTSQLWIAGTWLAAAVTPVLVTLLSEALHRPTEKIARAWTSDRATVRPAQRVPADAPGRSLPPTRPTNGSDPPVRIYRQPSSRAPERSGRIAVRVVAVTAALAFAIAVVTITAGELIAGDSIGGGEQRTTFGLGGSKKKDDTDRQQEQTTPSGEERPQTTPDQTEPETTPEPTPAEPTQPSEPPPTEPVPSQPAPSTGTPGETAPAP